MVNQTKTIVLVFASLGTATNVLFNVPQLIRTYKTKNVVALSKKTIILRIVCSLCWAVYSLLLAEWLFLTTCVVNICSEVLLLVAKCRFKEPKDTSSVHMTVELK